VLGRLFPGLLDELVDAGAPSIFAIVSSNLTACLCAPTPVRASRSDSRSAQISALVVSDVALEQQDDAHDADD